MKRTLVGDERADFGGLSPSTEYEVRVTTICAEGFESNNYRSVTFTTLSEGPQPPPTDCPMTTGLQVRNFSAVAAEATWNAVEKPRQYETIRYDLDIQPYGLEHVPGLLYETNWPLWDLTPNTTYHLKVRTLCENVSERVYAYSEYSPTVSVTTINCDPLTPAEVKEARTTYNSATLEWTNIPNTRPFAEYRWLIEFRSTAPGQPSGWLEKGTRDKENIITIGEDGGMNPLVAGSDYDYRITTRCGKFVSSVPSRLFHFTTSTCPAPDHDSMEAKNISATSAKLTWTPTGVGNDVHYRAFCNGCSDSQAPWREISNVTDGNKAISGLTSGTKYEFQVRTICAGTPPQSWSRSATFTTLECSTTAPEVSVEDTGPSSDNRTRTALVKWTEPRGAIYYSFRYQESGGSDWTTIPIHLGNEQAISGLKRCTRYIAQVRSFCTQPGDPNPTFSDWSTKSFTTEGCVCENPMIRHSYDCNNWFAFKNLGSDDRDTNRWRARWATARVEDNEWRFRWKECTSFSNCSGPFATFSNYHFRQEKTCEINSGTRRHVDYFAEPLTMTLWHYYRLEAQYRCDNGQWSDWVGATYQIVLVDNLRISSVTASSATLRWDPIPGATSYVISYGAPHEETHSGLTVDGNTNTVTVPGLTSNTQYELDVTAVFPDGRSMPNSQNFTTASGKCSYSISPGSVVVGASGTGAKVTVTGSTGCSWMATSDVPWITITAGANGTGNGLVSYTVAANTLPEARNGTIAVAGFNFTVSQNGIEPNNPVPVIAAISPASAVVGGGPFTLHVTGSGFTNNSVVRVNGSNRTTAFQTSGLLSAAIPGTDLTRPFALGITVLNPAPGGGLSNEVSLTVSTPTGCVRNAPAVTVTPSDQRGYGGQQLSYRVAVTNNDTALCGATSFDVTPTLPGTGWGQSPTSMIFTIAPGESSARDVLIWSAPSASYNLHIIRETATSSAGHFGADSATYTVYSLQPPDTCGRANPTVTITPSDQRGYGGQQLTYRVFITNNDNPQCPAGNFSVTPTLPDPAWVHTPTSMGFTIVPGQTVWRDVVVSSAPDAEFASHVLTETATSGTGHQGSSLATYTVYDLMPPDTCGRSNPTVTISPSYQTGTQAETLDYVVTVTNNDAPGCPASSFTVTPALPTVSQGQVWTHVPQGYFTIFAAPGQSGSRGIQVTSASLAEIGEHAVTWTASHTRDNFGSGDAIFNVIPYGAVNLWQKSWFDRPGYAYALPYDLTYTPEDRLWLWRKENSLLRMIKNFSGGTRLTNRSDDSQSPTFRSALKHGHP